MIHSLLILMLITAPINFSSTVSSNRNLIVPGVGAGGFKLGQTLLDIKYIASKIPVVSLSRSKAFNSLIKCKAPRLFSFNKAVLLNQTALFFNKGRVCGIFILNDNGITSDMVQLKKGVEYFLFIYGNNDLEKVQCGSSSVYIYLKRGIAIVDDNSDNTIDLVVIFKSKSK